jgi:hypothetical protein
LSIIISFKRNPFRPMLVSNRVYHTRSVMPDLVPGSHVLTALKQEKPSMGRTRPAMTEHVLPPALGRRLELRAARPACHTGICNDAIIVFGSV